MPWYQEITQWENPQQKNHFYLLSDNRTKMFAYVKFGRGKPQLFSNPIGFDVRGRKFQKIPDRWNIKLDQEPSTGQSWVVAGSKGDQYTVVCDSHKWTCSCHGFTFRGKCRHIDQIQTTQKVK